MTWVKICGVRDVETARQIAVFRPDAIGLNFYARSVRAVTPEIAAEIVRALPSFVEPVGVFVNATASDVADTMRRCGLSRVQFHGDEPPELLAEFHGLSPATSIMRAWRRGAEGLAALREHLSRCEALGVLIAAVIIEARVPGEYGGTGTVLPWAELRHEVELLALPPLILAGGLNPGNVADAVAAVSPWGVDVASGVESSSGIKDPDLVAKFIECARRTPEVCG